MVLDRLYTSGRESTVLKLERVRCCNMKVQVPGARKKRGGLWAQLATRQPVQNCHVSAVERLVYLHGPAQAKRLSYP